MDMRVSPNIYYQDLSSTLHFPLKYLSHPFSFIICLTLIFLIFFMIPLFQVAHLQVMESKKFKIPKK